MKQYVWDSSKFYLVIYEKAEYSIRTYKCKKSAAKAGKQRKSFSVSVEVFSGNALNAVNVSAILNSGNPVEEFLEEFVLYWNEPMFVSFLLSRETTEEFIKQITRFHACFGLATIMLDNPDILFRFDKFISSTLDCDRVNNAASNKIKHALNIKIGFSLEQVKALESLDENSFCLETNITYARKPYSFTVKCEKGQDFRFVLEKHARKKNSEFFGYDDFNALVTHLKRVI